MKNTKTKLISSVTVLLICFAMLIGSTFAWFTDSASTGVNKIQAGNLDVSLEMANSWDSNGKPTSYTDAEGQNLAWQKAVGFESQEVLWEPGITYELPLLKITNLGNLETQFQVLINGVTGTDKNGNSTTKLLDALDFEITYFPDEDFIDGITAEQLAGITSSFRGSSLNNLPYTIVRPSYFIETGLTGIRLRKNGSGADTYYVRIRAHMDESANNDYQGLSLDNIGITVVATQLPEEHDSFNNQYDKDAEYALPVSTAEEFASALASGNDIILNGNIQMPEVIEIKNDVTIYGSENGRLLVPDNADRVINITETTEPVTLTLSNVDVVGPTTGTYTRGVSVYNNSDVTVVVDNSSISASYYALNIASENDNVEAVIQNTTITGWCAFQTWSAGTKATFKNCKLIGNNDKAYNAEGWNNFATVVINEGTTNTELVFENCDIEANQTTGNKQYLLSVRASGANVTLNNCRFYADGSEIADDDLGNYLNIYSEASDLTLTIDGTVIPIQ